MATRNMSCFVLDDYSAEEGFEIKVDENETICNLVEIIKRSKTGFRNAKFLKVDLPSDTLSDKLAFLESNPSANIKRILSGEELTATETTILENFGNMDHYIIIVPPTPHFTFIKCIGEKKLVPSDKIIYKYSNGYLEGEITNTFKIRCIKDREEYHLDSFSKFIKLAIAPYDIKSKHWKNLWVELHESKKQLIWRDFRHCMLDESNDITNRMRVLKLESTMQSSQQTEGGNSIEDDTKGKEIITLPKKMEEKHDSNETSYNRIHFSNPIISIKSGDNIKHIDASDLFSVKATLSRGTSANTHNKAEYLYNKLVSKKDAIDGIFESQPVYAIGPIFHENNTFPFIACWGAKSLGQSTLNNLEKLFDYEFKAVSYQVTEPVHCGNELSSGSGDSGGFREIRKDDHDRDRGDGSGRKGGNNSGRDNSGKGSGNDSGRGDGSRSRGDGSGNSGDGGGDDAGIDNDKKVILVSSRASVKSEDNDHIQDFDIKLRLHAKIDEFSEIDFDEIFNLSEIPKFSIDIDVYQCETTVMLSEIWEALSNVGQGYSLESVKIIISSIHDPDHNPISREHYHPREKNTPIEYTENFEQGGNVELAVAPKIAKIGYQAKKSRSTKVVSNEWILKTRGDIIKWLYKKNTDDLKIDFAPGLHECEGSIISEHLRGFQVTVIQVFKFVPYRNIFSLLGKPKLIMCPQISHNLEITFSDLKDFNKKFAKLGSLHKEPRDMTFTAKTGNDINIPKGSANKNSGIMDIKRSFVEDKNKDNQ